MEKCAERSVKENVKGKQTVLGGTGNEKTLFASSSSLLKHYKVSHPRKQNSRYHHCDGSTLYNLIAFFVLAGLTSSHHNIVHIQ